MILPKSSSDCKRIFFEEFSQYLETIIMSADPLLIVGDFNIHVNSKLDNDVQKVLDLLQSMGLQQQHVEFPTHVYLATPWTLLLLGM